MRITSTRKELMEAISNVSKAVANKPQVPACSGIYMKAEGSSLEMQANNFELGIITRIPVNVEKPGEIVVGGKFIQDVMRKLPGDIVSITFDAEAHVAVFRSDGTEYTLLSLTPEDFPKVKLPDPEVTFKINAPIFKDLVRKTSYACSSDETRPLFTGCLLETKGREITMVATNTHRIAIMKEDVGEQMQDLSYIIPSKALQEVQRIVDSAFDNFISISCSQKNIAFTFDNVQLVTRLIEGQYPPYDKVIPRESTVKVSVDAKELLTAIDHVSLISKETDYKTVRMIFNAEEGINVSSKSPEIGKAEENVAATIEGDELDISFNYNYISDVLKAMDTKICHIGLSGHLKPADIREDENDNFVYIVTPVRTI